MIEAIQGLRFAYSPPSVVAAAKKLLALAKRNYEIEQAEDDRVNADKSSGYKLLRSWGPYWNMKIPTLEFVIERYATMPSDMIVYLTFDEMTLVGLWPRYD